jgi:hypothetical protein
MIWDMKKQSNTIIKSEKDPAFVAHVSERIKKAADPRNSVPINEFFERRKLRRESEKVKRYARV